jgi:hypothetical protein
MVESMECEMVVKLVDVKVEMMVEKMVLMSVEKWVVEMVD